MFDYSILPDNLQGGMQRYIEHGIPPGDFLRACLANDLVGAVGLASSRNYDYLHSVCMFLYHELPSRWAKDSPWGSYEAIQKHMKRVLETKKGGGESVEPTDVHADPRSFGNTTHAPAGQGPAGDQEAVSADG